MDLSYQCFVVAHLSGRVTVTPLALPHMAVHANTVESALDELALAIDERISRTHPNRIARYVAAREGRLVTLEVAALRLWSNTDVVERPISMSCIFAPAHRPFVEAYVPRVDMRLWLADGDDLIERTTALITEHVRELDDAARLALRREAPESIVDLRVQITPPRLSALPLRYVAMAERPARVRTADVDTDEDPPDDESDDGQDADGVGRRQPSRAAPTLRRMGVAMHRLARDGRLEATFERDASAQRLTRRLSRKPHDAIVLVGPAGVGKTAVLNELCRRIVAAGDRARAAAKGRKDAPPAPLIFHLDATRWVAGEGFFGDWQRQTYDAWEEARRTDALLLIGHVVELLDAGRHAHSDVNVAELVAPLLGRRDVRVVGEATVEAWARVERRNESFARMFTVVRLDEPDREATLRIVTKVAETVGRRHGLEIAAGTADAATALVRRFWPYGALIGNAVNFVRRLVDSCVHRRLARVTPAEAVNLFSSESGIPVGLLRDDVPLDASRVSTFLAERVLGQSAAVERVAEVIGVIKAGMSDTRRPIGVLFLAGPTGVGKTELTKALAEYVFSSRERMVRLDMGEYAGPDALDRLLGGPGAPGYLVAAVRRQPFAVVLLDEIEKAHPAVFDALLGVLGDGRLSDTDGRFTDFRNCIIVMTSNLGADTLRARVGFGAASASDAQRQAMRHHYVAEAERFFRPELFNRIDDFIVFDPLDETTLRAIVDRELSLLARRDGLRRAAVTVDVSAGARDRLARDGFDARYGARPLKRTIERDVTQQLGTFLSRQPQIVPTRLAADVDRKTDRISLTATSIGAAAAGLDTLSMLATRAADLRRDLHVWSNCALGKRLAERVHWFDRASRLPAFWDDRALAEQAAMQAALARSLVEDYASAIRQASALEDLAFETYWDGRATEADAFVPELDELLPHFQSLKERLYGTLYPPRGRAVLYLSSTPTSWASLAWLLEAYTTFATVRRLGAAVHTAVFVPPARREAGAEDEAYAWRPGVIPPAPGEWPGAMALWMPDRPVTDAARSARWLLSAEHGVHRVQDGATHALVRVRFEVMEDADLRPVSKLEPLWPSHEIRRVLRHRDIVKDLRIGTDFALVEGRIDIAPMLDAYMKYRVFLDEVEPWS